MKKEMEQRLAATMTVRSFGILEEYSTSFNNLEMIGDDGTVTQYAPPTNLRLEMSNIPAIKKDGEPVIMSSDEIVLCRLGLDRNGLTRAGRASLGDENLAALEFYESLDVLEYKARLVIAYGKRDMVAPQEAVNRRALGYIGPEIERLILDGVMDVMFADEHNPTAGTLKSGRHQDTSVDLHWLRRIIRKQRPGDKLDFGNYQLRLAGDISQTLSGDSRFITHVIFIKWPSRDARKRPLDRVSGRLGIDGRGYLIVLRMQDVRHAIETYASQIVPYPEKTGTMHQYWLEDHPTPELLDEPGPDKFLATILAAFDEDPGTEPAPEEPADEPAEEDAPAEEAAPQESDPAPENPTDPTAEASPETAPQAVADELPPEVRDLLSN
jgi:hypothetical protein